MKKTFLLVSLLSAAALPAFSQGRDTAFAVQKLFRQKRGGGDGVAATGAAIMAGELASPRPVASSLAAAAVLGGVPTVLGLTKANRYSPQREAAILQSYAAGWPIPADVRRRLRRRHFHRSTRDVLTGRL